MSPRGRTPWGSVIGAPSLALGHLCCLETFRPLGDLEFDFLPFVERFKSLAFNDRKVHEDVFPYSEDVRFPRG